MFFYKCQEDHKTNKEGTDAAPASPFMVAYQWQ